MELLLTCVNKFVGFELFEEEGDGLGNTGFWGCANSGEVANTLLDTLLALLLLLNKLFENDGVDVDG